MGNEVCWASGEAVREAALGWGLAEQRAQGHQMVNVEAGCQSEAMLPSKV